MRTRTYGAVVALLISLGYNVGCASHSLATAVVALLISLGYNLSYCRGKVKHAVVALLISLGYNAMAGRKSVPQPWLPS